MTTGKACLCLSFLIFLPHSIVERLEENNYKDVKIDPVLSRLAGVHPETE